MGGRKSDCELVRACVSLSLHISGDHTNLDNIIRHFLLLTILKLYLFLTAQKLNQFNRDLSFLHLNCLLTQTSLQSTAILFFTLRKTLLYTLTGLLYYGIRVLQDLIYRNYETIFIFLVFCNYRLISRQ